MYINNTVENLYECRALGLVDRVFPFSQGVEGSTLMNGTCSVDFSNPVY